MPRTCSICNHPKRSVIDRAILTGEPYRDVAGRYNVSKSAVERHRTSCLTEQLVKVAEKHAEADVRTAIDVASQLKAINGAAMSVLKEARAAKDGDLALKAIDRIQRQLELQAKLIGDLTDGHVTNITINPEWVSIRSVIVSALVPYPEARHAVTERLAVMEGGVGHAAA